MLETGPGASLGPAAASGTRPRSPGTKGKAETQLKAFAPCWGVLSLGRALWDGEWMHVINFGMQRLMQARF
uniref:Uncharacterized protein n=1 Tax=Ficedula albicollis TaxID=59894 RepID=A0A803VJP9_FICAL